MSKKKTKDISSSNGKYIISVPIISKNFVKKNGEITEHKEMYLQRSIQDYYIKFCESKINKEDLENQLSTTAGKIKIATLEVEFLDGYWDICNGDFEQQSRIGSYAIIHRIVK